MELDTLDRQAVVPDSHDFAVIKAPGRDGEARGNAAALDRQGVVPSDSHRVFQPCKQTLSIVLDLT